MNDKSGNSPAVIDPSSDDALTDVTHATLERLKPYVDEAERQQVEVIIRETISEVSHHSGPLPRPSDMVRYERIKKGFAERIMRMAEKEQGKRHDITGNVVARDYRLKSVGQACAMASVIFLTCLSAYIASLGDTRSAAWVACVAIVGVVGVFVTGRLADSRESRSKNEDDD